jgi:1,4-alpha-glucan branching enzyme
MNGKPSKQNKGENMKRARPGGKRRVELRLQTESGKNVFVAGSFNNWNRSRTRLEEKRTCVYAVALQLPVGRHEYKFVVDDDWRIDPENPETAPNPFGSLNSVITVN